TSVPKAEPLAAASSPRARRNRWPGTRPRRRDISWRSCVVGLPQLRQSRLWCEYHKIVMPPQARLVSTPANSLRNKEFSEIFYTAVRRASTLLSRTPHVLLCPRG